MLLVVVCAVTASLCVLHNIDHAYLVKALRLSVPDAALSADFFDQLMHFHAGRVRGEV